MLLLAQSLQETNQLDKAMQVAHDGVAQHPASEFISQFRGRIATVRRLIQGGDAAAQPAVPAAAPAPAPVAAPAAQPAPQ
jgi:hypothetical protein